MKMLLLATAIMLLLKPSPTNNDLTEAGIIGKVKSTTTTVYKWEAIGHGAQISKEVYLYNREGMMTQIENYDKDNKLISKSVNSFDANGNPYFSKVNGPENMRPGTRKRLFDANNLCTELKAFDEKGNLTQTVSYTNDGNNAIAVTSHKANGDLYYTEKRSHTKFNAIDTLHLKYTNGDDVLFTYQYNAQGVRIAESQLYHQNGSTFTIRYEMKKFDKTGNWVYYILYHDDAFADIAERTIEYYD